jgi:uncharacterized protein
MDTPIPVDLGRIAQDLQIRRVQVENVVALLDEGSTVTFIARYRRDRTGGLPEPILREIQFRVRRLRDLAERKNTIIKTIETQGKMSDELREAIRAADSPKRVEDLFLPYKPKKRTAAADAREKGLEALALRIWNHDETLTDLTAAAQDFLNPEKGLEAPEQVLSGVRDILAESIAELATVRDAIRRAIWKFGRILTSKIETVHEGQGSEYRDFFQFNDSLQHVPAHRILVINRGEKENVLKVSLDVPRLELERALFGQLPLEGHPQSEFFRDSAIQALDRILLPAFEREVRRDLADIADRHAAEVFGRNLRNLLLQPPLENQTVLAIDPGFRNGCKIAVLDPSGNLLEHATIYPHQPQNKRYEAKQAIKDLIAKHQVTLIAIGNGTACRETEELIADVIAEGTHFHEHPDQPFPVKIRGQAQTQAQAQPPRESSGAAAASQAPTESVAPDESSPASTGESTSQSENPPLDTAPPPESVEPFQPESTHDSLPDASSIDSGAETTTELPVNPAFAETSEFPQRESQNNPSPDSDLPGEGNGSSSNIESELPPISGGEHDDPEPPAEPLPGDAAPEPAENPPAEPDLNASSMPEEPAAPAETPQSEEPLPEPAPAVAAHLETSEPPGESAEHPPATSESGPPSEEASAESLSAPTESTAESAEAPPQPQAAAARSDSVPAPAADLLRPPKGVKSEPQPPKPPRVKLPPPPPAPHAADSLLARLCYVIVNEAGAAAYAASALAKEEIPEGDNALRAAVSLGRRVQNPLAELVKVEPHQMSFGPHPHDLNAKPLRELLDGVVDSCVNHVGVDPSTASPTLLRRVSGLNPVLAARIAEWRNTNGAFTARTQLLEIEGITEQVYTQSAGFLKIRGPEPLDATFLHPEQYDLARRILAQAGLEPQALVDPARRAEVQEKLAALDLPNLAKELSLTEPALRDLLELLSRGDHDPRLDLPTPIFKRGVLKLDELQPGAELKGTVLNVVDFGAFVDVGLKDSGLVHISQLANRYVKSPHDILSVGDIVTVWVLSIDRDRKRVSLTMVKPGTERSKPPERKPGPPEPRPQRGLERRVRQSGTADRSRDRTPPADQPAKPAVEEKKVNLRIPGPPQRLQQGGRGGQRRPGGPGRGGDRDRSSMGAPQGGERSAEAQRPAPKPKPAPSPQPLSQGALTGSVPLRTFGQLKQYFEAKSKTGEDEPQEDSPPAPGQENAPQASLPPESPPETPESLDPSAVHASASTDAGPEPPPEEAPAAHEAPPDEPSPADQPV